MEAELTTLALCKELNSLLLDQDRLHQAVSNLKNLLPIT